jgi:hypothetical protein
MSFKTFINCWSAGYYIFTVKSGYLYILSVQFVLCYHRSIWHVLFPKKWYCLLFVFISCPYIRFTSCWVNCVGPVGFHVSLPEDKKDIQATNIKDSNDNPAITITDEDPKPRCQSKNSMGHSQTNMSLVNSQFQYMDIF